MKCARDVGLVIESRTDADHGIRRGNGAQPERGGQMPMLECQCSCAVGDGSALIAAGVAHPHFSCGRTIHMYDELSSMQRLDHMERLFGRGGAAAGIIAAGAAACVAAT